MSIRAWQRKVKQSRYIKEAKMEKMGEGGGEVTPEEREEGMLGWDEGDFLRIPMKVLLCS